jgi:hypothetical protein
VLVDFGPKLIMGLAANGFLGDEYEEWMKYVPAYDKEKYIIIPVFPFYTTDAKGERKAIYARLPHDDTNRPIAAATWAMFQNRSRLLSRTVGTVAGEFPGWNPAINLVLGKWAPFLAGQNPRDNFRGRDIIPATEFEAGGLPALREMAKYTAEQFGVASNAADWVASAFGGGLRQGVTPPKPGSAEWVASHIPIFSTLIRVSNRGLTEERRAVVTEERQEKEKVRADFSGSIDRANQRRVALNMLKEATLTPAELAEKRQLNGWYGTYYTPLVDELYEARTQGDDARYDDVMKQLEESVGRPGGGPRPPSPPRPPRPSSGPR